MLKPSLKVTALEGRKAFQKALVKWFLKSGKDYPWRRTQVPYEILISEVMLQQTQIATVLSRGFFSRFLDAFPDVGALAAADDEQLLKAWEGLGYYRRVRMLRETARVVIANHGGVFPTEVAALMTLPGVGRYTAGALRAFAFDLPAVLVDGNIARVLSRLMDFSDPVDDSAGQKQIWQWAGDLADSKQPRIYHAALMELGQTLCRPGVPDCLNCPVATFCRTRSPESLPVKRLKVKITEIDEHALWLMDSQGRLLLHQENGRRREGLWKLPTRDPSEFSTLPLLITQRYTITRYRVALHVHDGKSLKKRFSLMEGECWKNSESLLNLAMSSPFRRVIERLLGER